MEIPSSHSGIVNEMKVALCDKLRQGSPILLLDVAEVAGAATQEIMPKQAVAPVQPAYTAINTVANLVAIELRQASPSVRKFARELGVSLNEVKCTGPKGRITDADGMVMTNS